MTLRLRNVANSANGAHWEATLAHYAKRQGVLAQQCGQRVKWVPGGQMIAQKSMLDWVLLAPGGRIVFADTKTFAGEYFTFSQIDRRQMLLAQALEAMGATAGFIVAFRGTAEVAYFGAGQIVKAGARSRFLATDGTPLGSLNRLDLMPLFELGRDASDGVRQECGG